MMMMTMNEGHLEKKYIKTPADKKLIEVCQLFCGRFF